MRTDTSSLPFSTRRADVFQKLCNDLSQSRQLIFDDLPNLLEIQTVVLMADHISKPDNLRGFGNPRCHFGSGPPQASQSFSGDFELTLHRRAEHFIGEIVVESAP